MRIGLPHVFALFCALGAVGLAAEKPLCQVVWKPAPADAAEPPAVDAADLAAAAAALARGAPLVAVVEALGSEEVRRLLLALSRTVEGEGAALGNVLRATYVGVDCNTVRREPAPGKEREALLAPDENSWAFWNDPEGYLHGYFAHHWLHNGYSAVGAGCMRIWYTPAPAVPQGVAAVALRCSSDSATAPAVLSPDAFAPDSTPSFSFCRQIPQRTVLALAAEAEGARAIPEPAVGALSLLALAALLVRRRRASPTD